MCKYLIYSRRTLLAVWQVDGVPMSDSGAGSTCPVPTETCCNRIMSNPFATLLMSHAAGNYRALSSVTLSSIGGSIEGDMEGAAISIGAQHESMTGCSIFLGGSAAPKPGYLQLSAVCGATGRDIALSFPNLIINPGRLVVKLCTVPAASRVPTTQIWVRKP